MTVKAVVVSQESIRIKGGGIHTHTHTHRLPWSPRLPRPPWLPWFSWAPRSKRWDRESNLNSHLTSSVPHSERVYHWPLTRIHLCPTYEFHCWCLYTGKRQATAGAPALMDVSNPKVIDTARESSNSCNAVVKAVAQSILKLNKQRWSVTRADQMRIQSHDSYNIAIFRLCTPTAGRSQRACSWTHNYTLEKFISSLTSCMFSTTLLLLPLYMYVFSIILLIQSMYASWYWYEKASWWKYID